MIPFVRSGGRWGNQLTVWAGGAIFPGAIRPEEEVQIVCFREMPCLVADLATAQWNGRFELNCSGNCAVVRLRADAPDNNHSNRILYIIMNVCSGVVIIAAVVVAVVYVRRRRSRTCPDEGFAPLVAAVRSELTPD
jgi:hypothetical protein